VDIADSFHGFNLGSLDLAVREIPTIPESLLEVWVPMSERIYVNCDPIVVERTVAPVLFAGSSTYPIRAVTRNPDRLDLFVPGCDQGHL
jgi:hypothetical protein